MTLPMRPSSALWIALFVAGPIHRSCGQAPPELVLAGKPVSKWCRDLKYGAWFEAKKAAEVVARLGPDGKVAVPALVAGLKQKEARLACVVALGRIGPVAKSAVGKLKKYRRSTDLVLRDAVYRSLGEIGIDVVRVLVKELKESAVRPWAIAKLGSYGEVARASVPNLVAILGYVVKPLPRGLHRADIRARHGQKTAEAVRGRRLATAALGEIADRSKRTLRELQNRLKDPDPQVRSNALVALACQGSAAVPVLVQALRLRNDQVVASVIRILSALGPDAAPALPGLRKVAKRRSLKVSLALAAEAIPAIEAAGETLELARTDGDSKKRRTALAQVVRWEACAVPVLEEVFAGSHDDLKTFTVGELVSHQHAFQRKARSSAARQSALPPPRIPAATLLSTLLKLVKDANPRVAQRAVEAVCLLGPAAGSAASTFAQILQRSDDPRLRTAIAQSLPVLGADAGIAIPALVDGLRDAELRGSASPALAQIGRLAVPALVDALASDDLAVRLSSVHALDGIGHDAWKAVPALQALRQTAQPQLRSAVDRALAKITQ